MYTLTVECEHCGLSIFNRKSEPHYDVCLDVDVECPNLFYLFERPELEYHFETVCLNTLVRFVCNCHNSSKRVILCCVEF